MGSSLLDSVVFDKPSCNARSDIETADPILECLTKSSYNYYTTNDFLDNVLPSLGSSSDFNVSCVNIPGLRHKWAKLLFISQEC